MKSGNLMLCLLILLIVGCGCDMRGGDMLPPSRPVTAEPAPEYSDHESLLTEKEQKRIGQLDDSYDASIRLLKGGTYLSTFEYVVLLFKRGDAASLERGETILKTIISAQETSPASPHYGNWPWGITRTTGDRNPPLFFARPMLGQLWQMQDRMLPDMVSAFRESCRLLVYAAEHRWDVEVFAANRAGVAYTNVYSMYVETLALAGLRFDDSRLKQLAQDRWAVFYDHFTEYGIDEFLSRDYDNITFNALWSLYGIVTDEVQRSQVKEVMDYIFILKQAVTHPELYIPVVGMGRDDRKFVVGVDARSDFQNPDKTPEGYEIPEEVTRLRNRKDYPFEVNGRAGAYAFTFKSYQANENAAMGSMTGWGSYYSQQVHCMASVGTGTSARATLFVPGSFIHVSGFTDQKEMTALMVYNRLPTMWHRDQWKGNQDNISGTLSDFGVGLSTQWEEVSSGTGKVVLKSRGYCVYLFPYVLENNQIRWCGLRRVKRTRTSEKYHAADLDFEELLFPSDALWFGVYISVVPENTDVPAPEISFSEKDGNKVFATSEGHRLEIAQKDGVSVQVRDVDPLSLPRYSY